MTAKGRDSMAQGQGAISNAYALTDSQAVEQWRAAWATIAATTEQALKGLHPLHPRRPEMASLAMDARLAAAGVRGEPSLHSA